MSGNDIYTKVLLHLDGSDGGTTFTDSNVGGSAHTWAKVVSGANTATTSTAQAKFGSASLLTAGTYIATPDHADFAFGSGDFTIDAWFFLNTAGPSGGSGFIASQDGAGLGSGPGGWFLELNFVSAPVGTVLRFGTDGTVKITGTTNIGTGAWHHVAVVRTGNIFKLFVDGVQEGGDVAVVGSLSNPTVPLACGGWSAWKGYIDEFRLSVGVARWTSNFTPPTAAYDGNLSAVGTATADSTAAGVSAAAKASVGTALADSSAFGVYGSFLRAATRQYATAPTDSPRNEPFRGALESYTFTRSIAQGSLGTSAVGQGRLVIKNDDSYYDFIPARLSASGRNVTIKVGRFTDAYASAFTISAVSAKDYSIATDNITFTLQDFTFQLQVPAQPNLYGGTGGSDGGADLTGKKKPLAFGTPRHISLVLVDSAQPTYQAHDGTMQSVDAVYDRGVPLTFGSDRANYAALVAASVAAAHYDTCLAEGFIKLGGLPVGTPTADVHGENGSGFIYKTADIVRWFIAHKTSIVDPTGIDTATFTAVNTAQAAAIDFFLGPDDQPTVLDVCAELMGGIGGWCGFTRWGLVEVGIFTAPGTTAVQAFTKSRDMLSDPRREPIPNNQGNPQWRWRVPYQVNWTVQTTDLAGSVTAAYKSFAAQPSLLAIAQDTSIKTDYPFAQDPEPIKAYFANLADAQAEASRLLALYRTTRVLYRVSVPRYALGLRLGDTISMTHPRFDLANGRMMTLVEMTDNITLSDGQPGQIDSVEVVGYG